MKARLRGPELLRAAVNQILSHPETWNQSSWHCGSTHCIAGWCQVLGGNAPTESAAEDMRSMVGLSESEAHWLSSSGRRLGEIYSFAKKVIASPAGGFDCAGFDRAGFDHDGFDRAGFDRAGVDRDGLDRAGFNRDGFNRAGFNRAGFNRDGRDRDGKPLPML